jgi:hypothetical protein
MRHLFALALVAVGCGAAPTPTVHPVVVQVAPDVAADAARKVIDSRFGVDPHTGTADVIVSRVAFMDDSDWISNRWSRGWSSHPMISETWFRVIAVVEHPTPSQVAVRVIGIANTGDERFDGMEPYIASGDPRMPRWANLQVALMQAMINKQLSNAVH